MVIVLPESLAELPVRIVRGSHNEELVLDIRSSETETVCNGITEKRYAFIWRQNDYLKVELDEIQWIEADGSYSIVHLTGERMMTVSFSLSVVGKDLSANKFVRIHRSHIIHVAHIRSLVGNSVKIGDRLLSIGREYRKRFLADFIFIGTRQCYK